MVSEFCQLVERAKAELEKFCPIAKANERECSACLLSMKNNRRHNVKRLEKAGSDHSAISIWASRKQKACLWLKGLPLLKPTDIVPEEPRVVFDSGKSMPKWYAEAWHLPPKERAKLRSKTFPGIARAMAEQWAGIAEQGKVGE